MHLDPQHHMRTWQHYGVRVELFETGRRRQYGGSMVAYRFFVEAKDITIGALPEGDPHWHLLAEGDDYGVSPMHGSDSDDSVAGLLAFLTVRPGDTDAEFFDTHTLSHMRWLTTIGPDDISILVMDTEEEGRPLPTDIEPGSDEDRPLKQEEYSRD